MGLLPSGLYTEEEIQARLNYKSYEFVKRTGIRTSTDNHLVSVAGQRDYVLDDKAIDLLHVAFEDSDGNFITLPRGSTLEVDFMLADVLDNADPPSLYTIELGDVNTLSLLPPPSASNRVIHLIYTEKPNALPDTPLSTPLQLPDDFTPFIKYGALGDLFDKSGQTYDPQRAGVCKGLYELGVFVARSWIGT